MKKYLLICLSLIQSWAFAGPGASSIVLMPGFMYETEQQSTGGTDTVDSTTTKMNFKLGYMMSANFFLGGVYDSYTYENFSSEASKTSMGASLAYMGANWSFFFNYYLQSELDTGSTVLKGDGMAFEVSHSFWFGSWAIGPSLNYRILEYTEDDSGNSISARKYTELYPTVHLAFSF